MAIDETGEIAAALPGYDIGGEIGRGAYGVVVAGRHRRLGRKVAVKQLPRAFGDYPEVRRRFSAEAKILASLDHPHIVPIFDYVEHGGLCLLVMELLPGGTVRQWQASGISGQAACAIALATCSALDYAHQRGVLHRDVKPDNLLFTSVGLLKVTDFGIAKVVGDVALTRAGETPGTPLYMAPEQCLDQPLTPATDVYSTGLMLYELLAGAHPFSGSPDAVSTMYRQVHEEARPLKSLAREVPDTVAEVVMRAVAKDPAARYHSARGFGGALADAAAEAWTGSWPAGDALRIMSVGPIEATTGRPLTTVEVFGSLPDGPAGPVAGAIPTRQDDRVSRPLPPTVIRAPSPAPAPWPETPPAASSPEAPWPAADDRRAAPATARALPFPPAAGDPGRVPTQALYPSASARSGPTYPAYQPASPATPWQLPPPPRPPKVRSRRWIPAAAVLFAVVVVAGGVVALIKLQPRGPSSPGPTTPASPATVAAALNGLVHQSATARATLISTVASIQNCSANLQSAASALEAVVSTRQQVISQLGTLQVDVLPNGAAIRSAMTNALDDSIDADHDFEGWLSGITAAGGCTGQAPHDANWQAAQVASSTATEAKQTFAGLWNPVAKTYGLPGVTSATI